MLSSITRLMPATFRAFLMRILGARIGKGSYIGPGAIIAPGVNAGSNLKVGYNTRVYKRTYLGNSVRIGSDTTIHQMNISDRCRVGSWCLLANATIGNDSQIESRVTFTGFKDGCIKVGSHCYIGLNTIMDWSADIEIGDYVHVAGPAASFWTHSSIFQALNMEPLSSHGRKLTGSIRIGSGCWIGGGTVTYPGVTIGHHSVVLPNSVVNRDIPDYCFVGGNPCKVLRRIEADSESRGGFRFVSLDPGCPHVHSI